MNVPSATSVSAPAAPCLRVTVVTVVRNAAATIARTIESVRAQDHPDIDHLIIDAVSTDGTLDVIARYRDDRLTLVSEPDRGIYDGMNKAIARATGEVLYFLNADDRLHDPQVLGRVAAAFATAPEVDVIYTDHIGVNADGSHGVSVKPCPVPVAWFERTNFCHQAMFFRRRAFARQGSYDLSFRMLADMNWNLRALTDGVVFGYLPIRSCYFSNVGAHRSAAQAAVVAEERERIHTVFLRGKGPAGFATVRLPVPAETAAAGRRVLFLAHGPGQMNGPNIWLTRLLPALKSRGYSPRVLMFLARKAPCPIADQLRAAGIPCDIAPWAHTEDMVRMIISHVRANSCDLFVPNLNVQGYFAASVLKAAGIPTIGVLHSDDDFYRDLTDEFIRGQGGCHLSAAVSVSVFQHEALRALDHGSTRIVRAPYGAPVPETATSHRAKPFRFVYVGRLVEEQKRISDTVRGMIALLRRQPDTEFHLCGDGTGRPAVEALIKASGLGKRIRLHGNLPSDEVRRVLLDSQAMVLLSDYEGIPIALMEAMACGVVPICTKIRSGIGEIVQDGKSGLLVSDRDQDFIAAAERLLRDPALWARCSAAARAVIQKDFSIEGNADTWAQLLGELQAAALHSRRSIELPVRLNLPPVRTNPKGIAREDRRKPQTVSPSKTAAGIVPDKRGDLPVVLVRSHEYNYSETFVEDHVNHLTRNLTLLYGFPFPRFLKGGRSVLPEALESRLRSALAAGKGVPAGLWREYTAALAQFLKFCGAKSALVETGLMGAFVHEACEQAGLPYVVHFHGVDAFGKELLANWSGHYRKFFRTAASVVGVSKAMREQLIQLGSDEARTVLAPYGVAVDLPAMADPAKAPPHFVAVGRFVEKKAPQLTLQAFAAVHQVVPQATLVMMGDGPLLAGCRQWVQERGLATAVTFAGVCSREEVSRQLAAGRAFVQHSVTAGNGDSEGLPLAVLEAGAHGLPVVSTFHAGIPDAVRPEVDGFLVPERDVEGMSAAMLRLARDPGLAATLGASFRARVVANYSREVSLTRLLGILQAAAASRPLPQGGEPARLEDAAVAPAQPRNPRLVIAGDRNDQAAYIELGATLLDQDKFAGAYIAIAEGHRLSGGTPETAAALQQLESLGIVADAEVEKYRRRAGWVLSARSAQPRRILVVTNLLPPQEMGGYGRTVWEFTRELLARGHEVRVLTADMPHLLRKPGPEHAALEPNVARVLRLYGDWKDGVVVVEPDMAQRQAIARENHRLILHAIGDFRPDVIMAGNLDFVGHFFIQPALDRGIPVLHRLGNAMPGYEPAQSPRGPLFCVAGCSEWVNRGLRAKNYPISRYEVVPPGSPLTDYFRAWTPQRERLRIAYAGLLMPYKGAHVLVTALAHLKRAGIEFECTLAGDTTRPEYLESLRAIAQKYGFADQLNFPGFLGKRELAALFARSNVLVFPSVFEEPFGKTQIEAMAAGLLVVSSGSGGASEIIEDGKTGLLFKSSDPRDLAEKLFSAHRNPRAAEQIALAGQARAFEFTTEASVDRLERVFGELLATARGTDRSLAAHPAETVAESSAPVA
jgi:glycosyltransferase involved in cell wall biosynthesis